MADQKIVTRRRLTGAVFQSLDGVMQAPGAPEEDRSGGFRFGGWVAPYWDESMQEPTGKIFDEPEYDLLLGKRTYDIFSAYWPYNQDIPIGVRFQRINKYVLTHADEPLTWEGSHKLSGDTAKAVAEIKQSAGRDLLIQGSSTLYLPLLAAGLIDRLILMTFPVLLGEGKRIFDGSERPGALKLVDHFVSDKGVVFATYEPAGEVATGSFETKEPSDAELNRREKWAQEEARASTSKR
jgi:dihydrofolate reductase